MACTVTVGTPVQFTSTPGGGRPPYTFAWTFGVAGETSAEQNPTHTFTEAGNYLCVLVVTDLCGNTKQANVLVEVAEEPAEPSDSCAAAVTAGAVALDATHGATIPAGATNHWWYLGVNSTGVSQSVCVASSGLGSPGVAAWGITYTGASCAGIGTEGNVTGAGCNCGFNWPNGNGFWLNFINPTGSDVAYQFQATTSPPPCPPL
jgi:PKD repeat protein